jgi:hypothetical protein
MRDRSMSGAPRIILLSAEGVGTVDIFSKFSPVIDPRFSYVLQNSMAT